MKKRQQMTERHRRILAGASLVIFALFFLSAAWFIGRPMIRFVDEPQLFRAWVEDRGPMGAVLFVGMMVVQVIVAIIPGEPLEIGAGYAFGFWEGTLLCMLGILLGSAAVFQMVRRFGTKLLEVFFDREKVRSLRFLQDSKRRDLIIFLVMFIPGTPKDLLSYGVGLTDIPLRRWLAIAVVARIPSLITSTIGGDAVGRERYLFAAAVFVLTLVISLAGVLIYRRISKTKD